MSGQGARDPKTGKLISPTTDAQGNFAGYDIRQHTRATIENLKAVLESAGSSLANIVDVTVLLVNIADFDLFNEVYSEYFAQTAPARTTLAVRSLPMQNVIEIKAVAQIPS